MEGGRPSASSARHVAFDRTYGHWFCMDGRRRPSAEDLRRRRCNRAPVGFTAAGGLNTGLVHREPHGVVGARNSSMRLGRRGSRVLENSGGVAGEWGAFLSVVRRACNPAGCRLSGGEVSTAVL